MRINFTEKSWLVRFIKYVNRELNYTISMKYLIVIIVVLYQLFFNYLGFKIICNCENETIKVFSKKKTKVGGQVVTESSSQ